MKTDIHVVYSDLNDLLEDICEFLKDEVKNGTLSNKATNMANKLIERSKLQLCEISKVVPPDNDSGRYVDMQANKATISEYMSPDMKPVEEIQEIYSAVEVDQEMDAYSNDVCPYASLPANKLPADAKTGDVDRKERFFFIEHQKKLFAGICEDWLLIYHSDKDNKPIEHYCLKNYEAKEVEKRETSFELFPKDIKGKIHYFTATTVKDVIQWVAAINRISNPQCFTLNMPLPKAPIEQSDTHEIYEELKEQALPKQSKLAIIKEKPVVPKKPVLPPRLPELNDWATRKLPESPEDTYDILTPPEDIYDCINSNKQEDVSDEYNAVEFGYDEDTIYDIISAPEKTENGHDDDVEETYDFVESTPKEEERPPETSFKSKLFSKKSFSPEKSKLSFNFRKK